MVFEPTWLGEFVGTVDGPGFFVVAPNHMVKVYPGHGDPWRKCGRGSW